ncbi:MAG TPA: Mur ligase domain-containing protein, partial [Thermoanaerobaculia bacterium]
MNPSKLDIYCLAIGGTGMAPLACLLQEQGHRVRGTDGPLYPPMSTLLERAGISPAEGYDAAHLDPQPAEPRPDLVVIGNAIHRDNPEAVAAERLGLPIVSMPQALSRFFLDHHRSLVVAGTHGKTTTTAMAAWVYTACGRDPGYLIGGAPKDLPTSFHDGAGDSFIVEGDEYNAAYFDRGPKFLHYQPETLLLTSAEYDHADLYATPEALWDAYERLIALLPADGLLVACGDVSGNRPKVRELAARARCRTLFYGLEEGNELRPLGGIEELPEASRFRVHDAEAGEVEVTLPLAGGHNVA